MMRGDGLLVEATVTTSVDQPGKQLRIVAMARRFAEQPHHRARRLADVRFEVGVELVRRRVARVERERAAEGLLGAGFAVGRPVDVLADDAMAPSEPGPRRGEARVAIDRLLIE